MGSPGDRSQAYKPAPQWRAKLRYRARSLLRGLPAVEAAVVRLWRAGRHPIWRLQRSWVALVGGWTGTYARGIDVDKTFWVSPQRITYSSLREFGIQRFKGSVIGGDWDHLEHKFEELDVYVALRQVCIEEKDWSDTVFYRRVLGKLNSGETLWGCRTKSDFARRCADLEVLFQRIREEGYKSQREILRSRKDYDPRKVDAEVTLSIGRHGDLLFSDGAHRLAIAKLLDIQRIPVKVAVRHPEWMAFRRELFDYAEQMGGRVYQPITHPDLEDVPAFTQSENLLALIRESISATGGHLLDIGANLGYFCHRLEDEGFDCYAIEDSAVHRHFLEKLKRAENRKFKVLAELSVECPEIRDTRFAVTLFLRSLDYYLEDQGRHDRLTVALQRLRTQELFYWHHRFGGVPRVTVHRGLGAEESVQFLLRHSSLTRAECIADERDRPSLYRLR